MTVEYATCQYSKRVWRNMAIVRDSEGALVHGAGFSGVTPTSPLWDEAAIIGVPDTTQRVCVRHYDTRAKAAAALTKALKEKAK